MTTPAPPKLMSAAEFARRVDPPGCRSELVRGMVIELPPAKTDQGYYASEIDYAVKTFVRRHRLGITTAEGGYLLSRDPIRSGRQIRGSSRSIAFPGAASRRGNTSKARRISP